MVGVTTPLVQAKGIERVRKVVLGGGVNEKRVVSLGGAVVVGGVGKSGVAGGVVSGGVGNTQPKKVTKQPKATPPNARSPTPPVTPSGVPSTPPKQFKVVPKPLVERTPIQARYRASTENGGDWCQ